MATRRERVVLDVESNVSASMARDAAATALLKRELNSLSKTAIQTRTGVSSLNNSSDGLPALGRNSDRSGSSINQLSGRLALLVKTAGALGPAISPITVAVIPALAGLTTQLGFAVAAGGTAILAFQGVGDALKTMNDAHLKPTTANLEKARLAMEKLSPAGRDLVRQLREMGPALHDIRDAAQEGLFPGVIAGLDSLDALLPRVERIIGKIADATGDVFADGAASLAGPEWREFFHFLDAEARPTVITLGHTLGNLTKGLAELWMALDPLSDDFSQGLLQASERFAAWADNLDQTDGFQEFLAYVRETGPQVMDTIGSIADALLEIGEAAAPLGGPVLQGLELIADVVATIADSDLGTPIMAAVTAVSVLSLATTAWGKIAATSAGKMVVGNAKASAGVRTLTADLALLRRQSALVTLPGKNFIGPLTQAQTALGRVRASVAGLAKTTALVGGIAVASTGAADGIGLTNTASLALMGTIAGPWGAAIGGGIGLLMDFTAGYGDLSDEISRANAALGTGDVDALSASLEELHARQTELSYSNGVFSGLWNDFTGDSADAAAKAREVDAALWKIKTSGENGAHTFNQILAPALGTTARALDIATASTEDFRQQFELLNNALTGRASWRDYEAAIDAASAALKDNGKTLDITTEKGRANQAALDAIAATSIKVAENLQGMDRVRFLKRARQDFINAAHALGLTNDQAQALADKLGLLNTKPTKPKVDDREIRRAVKTGNELLDRLINLGLRPPAKPKVDKKPIDAAKASADGVLSALTLINGYHAKATVSIFGHTVFDSTKPITPALGTTVPGPRHPYRDRVPALLAPGEEVVSNKYGQADRNRALLKAINANQMADGGTAMAAQRGSYWRSQSSGGSGSSVQTVREAIDYQQLGRAIVDAVREGSPLVRLSDAGRGAYLSGADF